MKVCHLDGCTISQTGVCALSNLPEECPNFFEAVDDQADLGGPVLAAPTRNPTFPRSAALGTEEVSGMLGKRYGSVIGVLGAPDSGKTASLVSLYLLLANNCLDGYSFADSKSLMAFEEIARGARRWTGANPPDQMTTHTEMGDDRSAGMLHLRLRRESDSRCFDFFLPDLPGEWTNSLIDQNVAARLDFLRTADTIWIMMDGSAFFHPERRAHAVHRMCRLIDRVATFLSGRAAKVVLVVTRLDLGLPDKAKIQPMIDRAALHDISLKVHHIASFSDEQQITPAGKGISDLIDETLKIPSSNESFWPDVLSSLQTSRLSLKFGIFEGR